MGFSLVNATGEIKSGQLYLHNHLGELKPVGPILNRLIASAGMANGWQVTVDVARLRATRSNQSNRYYWGVVLQALSDYTGYTPEELHDICKAKFLPKEMAFLDGNGEVVEKFVLGGSTRKMDTKQFSEYVERIRDWASSALSLYIPTANEVGYGSGV